jgi:hypothetical protein
MSFTKSALNTTEFKGCYLPSLTHGQFVRVLPNGNSWHSIGLIPKTGSTWKQALEEIQGLQNEFADFYEQVHSNLLISEYITSGLYTSELVQFVDYAKYDLVSISGTTATLRRAVGDPDPYALTYSIPNPLWGEPGEPATIDITHRLPAHSELAPENSSVSGPGGMYVISTAGITASVAEEATFTVTLADSISDDTAIMTPWPDTGDPVRAGFGYYTLGWHQYVQPRRLYGCLTRSESTTIAAPDPTYTLESKRVLVPSIFAIDTSDGSDVSADIQSRTKVTHNTVPEYTTTIDFTGSDYTELNLTYQVEDTGGDVMVYGYDRCAHAKECPMKGIWGCGLAADSPEGLAYFPANGQCYQPGFCSGYEPDTPSQFISMAFLIPILTGFRIKAVQDAAGATDVIETVRTGPSVYSLCGPAGAGSIVADGYHENNWYYPKGGWEAWRTVTDGSGNETITSYEGYGMDIAGSGLIAPLTAFKNKKTNGGGTPRTIESGMILQSDPTMDLYSIGATSQLDAKRPRAVNLAPPDVTITHGSWSIGGATYVSKIQVPRLFDIYNRQAGTTVAGGTKLSTSIISASSAGTGLILLELKNLSETASSFTSVATETETTWLMGGTCVNPPAHKRVFNWKAASCCTGPMRNLCTERDIVRIDGMDFWVVACEAFGGEVQTIIPDSESGYGWTEATYKAAAVDIHTTSFSRWSDWETEYSLGDTVTISDPLGRLTIGELAEVAIEVRNDGCVGDTGVTVTLNGSAVSAGNILTYGAEGTIYSKVALQGKVDLACTLWDGSYMISGYELDAIKQTILNMRDDAGTQVI